MVKEVKNDFLFCLEGEIMSIKVIYDSYSDVCKDYAYGKKLLDEIHQLEEKIVHIDKELCKEEVYTDAQKMKDYSREKIEIQDKIENLYEKWEVLSIMLEEED